MPRCTGTLIPLRWLEHVPVGSSAYFSRWPYQPTWKQVTSPKETCHPTTHHLVFRSPCHPEAEALPISKDLARGLSICTVNREEVQWASVSLNHSAALLCMRAGRLSFPCYWIFTYHTWIKSLNTRPTLPDFTSHQQPMPCRPTQSMELCQPRTDGAYHATLR